MKMGHMLNRKICIPSEIISILNYNEDLIIVYISILTKTFNDFENWIHTVILIELILCIRILSKIFRSTV